MEQLCSGRPLASSDYGAVHRNGIAQDEAVSRKFLGASALELSNRKLRRKFNF